MTWKDRNARKLELLNPIFAGRVRKLLDFMEAKGYQLLITQGLRTWEEQDALYAKGRTVLSDVGCNHGGVHIEPGTCKLHPLGATVTKAQGGCSQHNFGLAVDLCPMDGEKLDWDTSHPAWKELLSAAPHFGLEEGAKWRTFPDTPHFYPAEIPATTAGLRQQYAKGGFAATWAWFEAQIPTEIRNV